MRRLFSSLLLSLVLSLVLALPAKADEAAMQGVISSQIEAFQADDFTTAFSFASPTIQGLFGNADNFGTMVQQGYPMVWRPADVQFLSAEMIDGLLWQPVLVRDQQGQLHILEYQMVNGENGWKINAVRFRKEPAGTA